MSGKGGDLLINFPVYLLQVRINTVQKADTQSNGTHIQIFLLDHFIGLIDLIHIYHNLSYLSFLPGVSDAVHLGKDILMLHMDRHADFFPHFFQFLGKYIQLFRGQAGICDHHHIEISIYNGLGNIQDIHPVLCQISTYLCDNAYSIFSHYSNNCLFHDSAPFLNGDQVGYSVPVGHGNLKI